MEASGRSDIEGKAARVAASERRQRTSFNNAPRSQVALGNGRYRGSRTAVLAPPRAFPSTTWERGVSRWSTPWRVNDPALQKKTLIRRLQGSRIANASGSQVALGNRRRRGSRTAILAPLRGFPITTGERGIRSLSGHCRAGAPSAALLIGNRRGSGLQVASTRKRSVLPYKSIRAIRVIRGPILCSAQSPTPQRRSTDPRIPRKLASAFPPRAGQTGGSQVPRATRFR